ncbi:MAG: ATP-binding cassette domain-containing protein [Candidatus Poribacteria bacterium]|nr:ATP-binding cassette domain-containing protein [Candidatus Poribacteria bacterium]
MQVIKINDLYKTFKTYKRKKGFIGSIQTLFTKEYTTVNAVDGVSFGIDQGEIVGYVGPNGAGKSTTIKMLTGILYPTSGVIEVCGLVPTKDRRQNLMHIGVVFGQRTQLWWDLPLIESFELLRHIYRVPEKIYKDNIALFAELLDIEEFINIPVRLLSLGQRMRGDIAASLLHNPDILYLDEPTIGLDVVVKERIRQFIKEINIERKTTVILTTHDLSDIEALCNRIMIIDYGKVIYDGSIDEIRRRFGTESTLLIDFKEPPDQLEVDGALEVRLEGIRASIKFDRKRFAANDLISEIAGKYPVLDLTIEDISLDGIIRDVYEEGKLHESVS